MSSAPEILLTIGGAKTDGKRAMEYAEKEQAFEEKKIGKLDRIRGRRAGLRRGGEELKREGKEEELKMEGKEEELKREGKEKN